MSIFLGKQAVLQSPSLFKKPVQSNHRNPIQAIKQTSISHDSAATTRMVLESPVPAKGSFLFSPNNSFLSAQ